MNPIATDNPFSQEEINLVAMLAGMMIPASTKYKAPGADDNIIVADILRTARQQVGLIKEGLKDFDSYAHGEHCGSFLSLDKDIRMLIVAYFQQHSPNFMASITRIILQSYYRDERVMESLGMEVRPPFPGGYELVEGDWSLLDPVRDRGKIWRDEPGAR